VGFYPLDEELELSSHRKQADMQKAAATLAAEVPYETAGQLFSELTGLSLSDHLAHEIVGELTEGLTVLDVSPTAEEIAQVAEGRTWRPILVLVIDGADVPTRPEEAKGRRPGRKRKRAKRARWQGEWREAFDYLVEGERIVHLLIWHQVNSDEELAEALRQVKGAGLIPEEQVRLCVIADGARWIWKHVNALFPSAVQILDHYHCSEHLHQVAAVQFGDHPEKAAEWVVGGSDRGPPLLREGGGVIGDLEQMDACDEPAEEEIRKLIGYLRNDQDRVDYGSARKGAIRSAVGGSSRRTNLSAMCG
jgi:hypothetical protein